MLEAVFFRSESGHEPVREWLKSLSRAECREIGNDIDLVQQGWPVGKPLVDSLGHGLWEIRSRLNDRIARVVFFPDRQHMVLLHGFIKKSQKTPSQDMELARKRKQAYEKQGRK